MDFESASAYARKIEKSALPSVQYEGEVEFSLTVDLSPKEIEDFVYQDLLNLYQKLGKINKTSKLFSGQVSVAKSSARSAEVESKMKSITENALKNVDALRNVKAPEEVPVEVKKGPEDFTIDFEKFEHPSEKAPKETKFESEFDFEIAPREKEVGVRPIRGQETPEEKEGFEIEPDEKEKKEEVDIVDLEPEKIEEKLEEQVGKAERKEVQKRQIPSILRSADEAATKKYDEMQEQLHTQMDSGMSVTDIQKKMLDLTKELFKEKNTSKREKIKLQITVLKNMLSGTAGEAGVTGAGRKAAAKTPSVDYSAKMYDALISTQNAELSNAKDSLVTQYSNKLNSLKTEFYNAVSSVDYSDVPTRKKAYGHLLDFFTSLVKSLPSEISKRKDFLVTKHKNEWDRLASSPELKKKKAVGSKIDDVSSSLNTRYSKEFNSAKEIVVRQVEVAIESASREVSKEVASVSASKKPDPTQVIFDINNTDEGTLLYHLHSNEPEYYKKYERNHVSKYEALAYAKSLIAKEKGLSKDIINKYFGKSGEK
ncbi:MAG: hypothetical protein ABII22_02520 [Candidatus Micrarchaeota archaeon]